MKILLASDHAGFKLKNVVLSHLLGKGYDVEDLGPYEYDENDDYPDFIRPLAKRVSKEKDSMGIIFGGSGQGEAIVANRFNGVYAAVLNNNNIELVKLARLHNNANVLSLGARFVENDEAISLVEEFINTEFLGGERHVRRISKI